MKKKDVLVILKSIKMKKIILVIVITIMGIVGIKYVIDNILIPITAGVIGYFDSEQNY